MDVPPIVFVKGQDPTTSLIELKRALLKQAEDSFDLGFAAHPSDRGRILWQVQCLMSTQNMRSALFPVSPLRRADIPALAPRIKEDEVDKEELERLGVIGAYDRSTHLYASLYVLPAPLPVARQGPAHAEEYAQTRPYIQSSIHCRLPGGESAYYAVVGAFGLTGSLVVDAREQGPVGYYHLAKECWNGSAEPLRTQSVRHMDGMKIYWPVQIREGENVYDRTFVVSTTVSVWEGFKGWLKNRSSDEHHAAVYGLGGVSEILAVLKRLP